MEETSTFGPHVNSTAERIEHRANRRVALMSGVSIENILRYTAYCRTHRRDLSKPRKIR